MSIETTVLNAAGTWRPTEAEGVGCIRVSLDSLVLGTLVDGRVCAARQGVNGFSALPSSAGECFRKGWGSGVITRANYISESTHTVTCMSPYIFCMYIHIHTCLIFMYIYVYI